MTITILKIIALAFTLLTPLLIVSRLKAAERAKTLSTLSEEERAAAAKKDQSSGLITNAVLCVLMLAGLGWFVLVTQ